MSESNDALVALYGKERAERIIALLAQVAEARRELLSLIWNVPLPKE